MLTDTRPGTDADRLRLMGFDLTFEVDPLFVPIKDDEGHEFHCKTRVIANPVRGDARRQFAEKGQVAGEALSNLPAESFPHRRELRDLYAERCAQAILEMLRKDKPGLKTPPGGGG